MDRQLPPTSEAEGGRVVREAQAESCEGREAGPGLQKLEDGSVGSDGWSAGRSAVAQSNGTGGRREELSYLVKGVWVTLG